MIGPSSSPLGVSGSEVGDCSSLPGVSGAWTSVAAVLVTVSGVGVAVTVAVVVTVVVAGGALGASPPQPARRSAGTVIGRVMIAAANLDILMTTPLMMAVPRVRWPVAPAL